MRAWQYSQRGSPRNAISVNDSAPMPTIQATNQVLVRVAYVGMNQTFSDILMRIPTPFRPTTTCELDFCGVVVEAGTSVNLEFKPGTRVFGSLDDMRHIREGLGAMAEYVVVQEKIGRAHV